MYSCIMFTCACFMIMSRGNCICCNQHFSDNNRVEREGAVKRGVSRIVCFVWNDSKTNYDLCSKFEDTRSRSRWSCFFTLFHSLIQSLTPEPAADTLSSSE